VRPRDQNRGQLLMERLQAFRFARRPLIGLATKNHTVALVEQLLESIHRVEYIRVMRARDVSLLRRDPASELFDPLKAAVLHSRGGEIDEAFWLVFLSVHFGKPKRHGWKRIRDVYGGLSGAPVWTWNRTSHDPAGFRNWLDLNQDAISGSFGNHRKYQSLDAYSATGTGAAVESYIGWVGAENRHLQRFQTAQRNAEGDPRLAFDSLYDSLEAVVSFGRMAKFDYLTMVGKMGLADIEPGFAYLKGATGPLQGARLLFGDENRLISTAQMEQLLVNLGAQLGVGMQVIEDAICNWQKSPDRFRSFRG